MAHPGHGAKTSLCHGLGIPVLYYRYLRVFHSMMTSYPPFDMLPTKPRYPKACECHTRLTACLGRRRTFPKKTRHPTHSDSFLPLLFLLWQFSFFHLISYCFPFPPIQSHSLVTVTFTIQTITITITINIDI